MLICMKPNQSEREKLVREIKRARKKSPLSNSDLAALAMVDSGQTFRILEGNFKTVSGNVVQICNALGINPQAGAAKMPTRKQAIEHAAWAKLEASVRRAWDKTPQGAERLAAVIDAVAQVRGR